MADDYATDFDLDVDAPDKVSDVLRAAAQKFYESQTELQSAWQDKHAGWEWYGIARALESCAERIERELKRW